MTKGKRLFKNYPDWFIQAIIALVFYGSIAGLGYMVHKSGFGELPSGQTTTEECLPSPFGGCG